MEPLSPKAVLFLQDVVQATREGNQVFLLDPKRSVADRDEQTEVKRALEQVHAEVKGRRESDEPQPFDPIVVAFDEVALLDDADQRDRRPPSDA